MCAQLYVGRTTRYISLYGCKTDGQFVGTLQDEIRYRGAMNELISDIELKQKSVTKWQKSSDHTSSRGGSQNHTIITKITQKRASVTPRNSLTGSSILQVHLPRRGSLP